MEDETVGLGDGGFQEFQRLFVQNEEKKRQLNLSEMDNAFSYSVHLCKFVCCEWGWGSFK